MPDIDMGHAEERATDVAVGRRDNGAGALPKLARALRFAAAKHRRQRRKDADASPYINHPIDLLSILSEEGDVDCPDVLCAALLHDTIEDTDTSVEELRRTFGPRVSEIVVAVSDDKTLPKQERKRRQIQHAASARQEARLVKLADKIANLRDLQEYPPRDWDNARRLAYCNWALEVIDQLRGTHPGLEHLFDIAHARCVAMFAAVDDA
ncbi:MAG: HD domain-containing protein [Thiohalocapsa sp.]